MPSSSAVSSSAGRDREALELAEHVGEPEADEAHPAFLDGPQHVVELAAASGTSAAGPRTAIGSAGAAARGSGSQAVHIRGNGCEIAGWERAPGVADRASPGVRTAGIGSRRLAGAGTPDDGMRPANDEGDEVAEQRTPE